MAASNHSTMTQMLSWESIIRSRLVCCCIFEDFSAFDIFSTMLSLFPQNRDAVDIVPGLS